MDRRNFVRMMLGTAALVAPSQVWPFRKIFIPPAWPLPHWATIAGTKYYDGAWKIVNAEPPTLYEAPDGQTQFPIYDRDGKLTHQVMYYYVSANGYISLAAPGIVDIAHDGGLTRYMKSDAEWKNLVRRARR